MPRSWLVPDNGFFFEFCWLFSGRLADLTHRRIQQIRAAVFASFAYTEQSDYAEDFVGISQWKAAGVPKCFYETHDEALATNGS